MKKVIWISMVIAVAFAACKSTSNIKEEVEYTSNIKGLASPLRLKPDTTRFLITDYITGDVKADSLILEGKKLGTNALGEIVIPFNTSSPVSNMKVYAGGISHDIPVFRSEKIKYTFQYKATSDAVKEVGIAGSMNGWNYKASPLRLENGLWTGSFTLDPGLYQYRIWEDGKEMMDKNNTNTADNGLGGRNNVFEVGEKHALPSLIHSLETTRDSMVLLAPADLTTILVYCENRLIDFKRSGDRVSITIPAFAKNLDRSFIRVFASDAHHRTNDLLIPLTHGDVITASINLDRTDLQNSVMYFVMIDRFFDGDSTNNRPTLDKSILPQANNLGGDLQGIIAKIKSGYFKELGITTIWISPISRNAEGAWGLWDKGVKSTFSAYHGYWPTALTKVDDRLGSEQAFKELIDIAHENGMNVLLDYVAHHVHQDHLLYKQHPEWTTPLYLPDGTMNTEKWDEHRLTTWFDTFLPTWDFSKPEVVEALTDTAMCWVNNYDLDGFRHDATKHIPEAFWQTLTRKMKSQSDKKLFQIGETYGNPELISSYVNSGQMDAQFDFNLYDAMVDAFAKPETSFENLERVVNQSSTYYGSHHLMGNITGNQDRARFISYADGSVAFSEDPKLAGWTRKITNKSVDGYNRLLQLEAFMMTVPGIPCIYYGDEIGLPGANDPDNRRMMKFDGLDSLQNHVKTSLAALTKLRTSNMALTYGEMIPLYNSGNIYAFARNYFGKTAIVIFFKDQNGPATTLLGLDIPEGINVDGLKVFGEKQGVQINGRRIDIADLENTMGRDGFVILTN
jgi:cyclomaltodextrinase